MSTPVGQASGQMLKRRAAVPCVCDLAACVLRLRDAHRQAVRCERTLVAACGTAEPDLSAAPLDPLAIMVKASPTRLRNNKLMKRMPSGQNGLVLPVIHTRPPSIDAPVDTHEQPIHNRVSGDVGCHSNEIHVVLPTLYNICPYKYWALFELLKSRMQRDACT